jgi:hypothetical protein
VRIPDSHEVNQALTSASRTPASALPLSSIAQPDAETDRFTQQTAPSRFPWLSWLSERLAASANEINPFAAAPVLGDHLDQSA